MINVHKYKNPGVRVAVIWFIAVASVFLYLTRYQNIELGRNIEQYLLERVAVVDIADYSVRVVADWAEVSHVDGKLVAKGFPGIRWPVMPALKNVTNLPGSEYLAASVDVRFIENGYRGYVTLMVRDDEDPYSPRQWGLSDTVMWKGGGEGRLIIPFPKGLDLSRTQIELYSYSRAGREKQRVEIHGIALHRLAKRPDPGAMRLRLAAGLFIVVSLAMLVTFFRREIAIAVSGSLDVPPGEERRLLWITAGAAFINPVWMFVALTAGAVSWALRNHVARRQRFNRLVTISIATVAAVSLASLVFSIFGGKMFVRWDLAIVCIALYIALLIMANARSSPGGSADAGKHAFVFWTGTAILLSVAMLEAFPITSNHLRADAWQFDIVARSLAEGLGFKSYDVWELGSYPVVPIYFSVFHLFFGQGAVSTVWANSLAILAIWFILYRLLSTRPLSVLAIAGLLVVAWSPFWTAIGWSLSEDLSRLILIFIVYLCSLVYQRPSSGEPITALLVWLGVALGVGLLVRTDYIALFPVIFAWLAMAPKIEHRFKAMLVVGVMSMVTASPWWVFQATHETPYQSIRTSDAGRVKDAILVVAGLKPAGDFRPDDYWRNLRSSIREPFLIYVYDVPSRRNAEYSHVVHRMMLGLFLLAAVFSLRREGGIARPVAVLLVSLVLWRMGALALIDGLNRHFAHMIPLMILLIAAAASFLQRPRQS